MKFKKISETFLHNLAKYFDIEIEEIENVSAFSNYYIQGKIMVMIDYWDKNKNKRKK